MGTQRIKKELVDTYHIQADLEKAVEVLLGIPSGTAADSEIAAALEHIYKTYLKMRDYMKEQIKRGVF